MQAFQLNAYSIARRTPSLRIIRGQRLYQSLPGGIKLALAGEIKRRLLSMRQHCAHAMSILAA